MSRARRKPGQPRPEAPPREEGVGILRQARMQPDPERRRLHLRYVARRTKP